MNSNDNRIFTLQTGSYSNTTVDLTNSNMNQLMVRQTSYDNAVVLGSSANGNVGLIYKTNMRLHTFIKTALVAVLFISYHLNGFSSDLNPVQCQIRNNNLMLTVNNSIGIFIYGKYQELTLVSSKIQAAVQQKLILNINQFLQL
ncbi:hypothetical protein O9992_13745 [Vibrio lentus]|nr:hypothetical protein [Vibrio lentus]